MGASDRNFWFTAGFFFILLFGFVSYIYATSIDLENACRVACGGGYKYLHSDCICR